jgi:hypothetical protein
VSAINVVGESPLSSLGNGASVTNVPNAPINIIKNSLLTTATSISITWTNGSNDGGSSVIDYRVSYDQGTNNYVIIASAVPTAAFAVSGLTPGSFYKFKIEARNAIGYSSPSVEVSIQASSNPDPPVSLTRDSDNTMSNQVSFTWSDGSSNGSPVLDYRVSYDKGTQTWIVA